MQRTADLLGIGHRVVHGGEAFKQPALIDEEVLTGIAKTITLAPLNNPANLKGIEVALKICPEVPQVAVFDTAFHQTLPPHAFHYPYRIPYIKIIKSAAMDFMAPLIIMSPSRRRLI